MKNCLLVFFFICSSIQNCVAQLEIGKYTEKNEATYNSDCKKMYQQLKQSPPNAAHRICLGFMNDYGIRKNQKKIRHFCKKNERLILHLPFYNNKRFKI